MIADSVREHKCKCTQRHKSHFLAMCFISFGELNCHQNYRIYHWYSDALAWANSIDPDQTPQNAAFDKGLHCLPLVQKFLDTPPDSKKDSQIIGQVWLEAIVFE